jgi:hypothetical protein
MKVNLIVDSTFLIGYNTDMDKETKQLNILLGAIAVVAIAMPFIGDYTTRQVQPVQIDTTNMEVTPEVYEAILTASIGCDFKDYMREALADNKITYGEVRDISDICEVYMLEQADQPFARGRLKQEIEYIKNGGVSM